MKKTQKLTNVFTKTSGGCVILARNKSFIDSKKHSLSLLSDYFKGLNGSFSLISSLGIL